MSDNLTSRIRVFAGLVALCTASPALATEALIRAVTDLDFALDRSRDEIVFDLYGALWTMPRHGGTAEQQAQFGSALDRPAVSPDGRWLAAEYCPGRDCVIRLFDRVDNTTHDIMPGPWTSAMPVFSADSRTLAFASTRDGTYDIWTVALPDGEPARVSFGIGDELWPAFAEHASELVWVASVTDGYRLMRKRDSSPAEQLYASGERLEAPGYRPDGSLIAFYEGSTPRRLRMLLNDSSRVTKTLDASGSLDVQRPAWLDRQTVLVSAAGKPARLRFGESALEIVPLQAFVSITEQPATRVALVRAQPTANHGRYVLRVGRTYDSVTGTLGGPADIVIADDRIEAIGPPRAHGSDVVVFDHPRLTAVPGLVALNLAPDAADAARWMQHGFTRVVCLHPDCRPPAERMVAVDDSADDPARLALVASARTAGKGVVSARLFPDIAAGATVWLARTVPSRIYEDYARLLRERRAAIVLPVAGALADSVVLARTLTDRVLFAAEGDPERYARRLLDIAHAEIARSGAASDTLRALTLDAALETGFGAAAGRLAPGRLASLILVPGDPLTAPAGLFSPAAIVERGRYLTPAGLFASEYSN